MNSDPDATRADDPVSRRVDRRGGGWLISLLIALLLLLGGFAGFIIKQSSAVSAARDMAAYQRLAIAAQGFARWPDVAGRIGATDLPWKADGTGADAPQFEHVIRTPQLGRVPVAFGGCHEIRAQATAEQSGVPKKPPVVADLESDGVTVTGPTVTWDDIYGERARTALDKSTLVKTSLHSLDPTESGRVCFKLGPIGFEKILPVPEGFLSLMIIRQRPEVNGDLSSPGAPGAQALDKKGNSKSKPGDAIAIPTAYKQPRAGMRDGVVIAQVGNEFLPIRSIDELPDLDATLKRRAEEIVKATPKDGATYSAEAFAAARAYIETRNSDLLKPIETIIAGKEYRLYPYPIQLRQKDEAAPDNYLIVGVMSARSSSFLLGLDDDDLLAFGLMTALLLALVPFFRLANLGPVDGVKPIERAALGFGLLLVAALATGLFVLTWDSAREKTREDLQLTRTAQSLAKEIAHEIGGLPDKTRRLLKQRNLNKRDVCVPSDKVVRYALSVQKSRELQPQPDMVIFIDEDGHQSTDCPTLSFSERTSAFYDAHDRSYFQQARDGDTVLGTDKIAEDLAASLGLRLASDVGYGIERVLSRTDGVARTVFALRLCGDSKGATATSGGKPERCADTAHVRAGQAVVAGLNFTMTSMLAPNIAPDMELAVVDLADPGWKTVFHGDPQRAMTELFKLSLAEASHATFLSRIGSDDGGDCRVKLLHALPFSGTYIGTAYRMAALRVPCTPWAVVAFRPDAVRDRMSAKPAEMAVTIWLGGMALVVLVLIAVRFAAMDVGRSLLRTLWPDPRLETIYVDVATVAFVATVGVTLFYFAFGASVGVGWFVVLSVATGLAIIGWLAAENLALSRDGTAPTRLDRATERSFAAVMGLIVLLLAIVPVLLFASDAREYSHGAQVLGIARSTQIGAGRKEQERVRVSDSLFPSKYYLIPPLRAPKPANLPATITEKLLCQTERVPCPQTHGNHADDRLDEASLTDGQTLLLVVIALACVAIAGWSILMLCRNLFGFGVPLEAVDYPKMADSESADPPYDEDKTPDRAILVAGGGDRRLRLERYAKVNIDLYVNRSFAKLEARLTKLDDRPRPLVVVHNLELLLRDDNGRCEALKLLEDVARLQDARKRTGRPYRHFRLMLLADISPLDRFLQATEYRESREEGGTEGGLGDPAENIRWSRLLEDFTTYTGRVKPRDRTVTRDGMTAGMQYLLRELEYVADVPVRALLPDLDDTLTERDIIEWGGFLEDARERSISDFLASQLIEHYNYLWTISSRAEQILIHRFAAGELPNVRVAYALRSLVRRGIVVFDPAPRLMNRSFTQFVRSVERPELLRIWQSNAPKGLWTRIQGNVTVVMPLVLLLGAIIVLRGAIGVQSAFPLMLAAGPALLNTLFSTRRARSGATGGV